MTGKNKELIAKLNAETGKLVWKELQPHYARGAVITVQRGVDLIEIAVAFANDHREQVEVWLTSGEVARAQEEDAKDWTERDPVFWAVVVAPWVLVQELA